MTVCGEHCCAQWAAALSPQNIQSVHSVVFSASHFFWGFWALIQAKYSTIEFDFLGYAVLRFNQYFQMKPQVIGLQAPE
uniref:ethanolamine kinase n=1 Tax=Callorhinchus milii TaxID=7868 RepID=A0A4W3J6K9_CALMI